MSDSETTQAVLLTMLTLVTPDQLKSRVGNIPHDKRLQLIDAMATQHHPDAREKLAILEQAERAGVTLQ